MTLARDATLACTKGRKRHHCDCLPCRARWAVFGDNIPVSKQERRRSALAEDVINRLDQEPPEWYAAPGDSRK